MLEGFRRFDLRTSDPQVAIHGVVGGTGPPLLLLHGNPLTHIHRAWSPLDSSQDQAGDAPRRLSGRPGSP